ncbi:Putative transcriptional regulator [Photobacterium marinum]|uniref:Putative transcriptional regulator n=1 Tax=Photobacterium marinum TaxID=1056511 RepID=L8J6M4_9GAMM|nr:MULTISPECIES: helix-turn-helix domain-containing protein [Photobacterium]ELR63122.1 Putative transcriptional regulator [Photobacterium marinum]
MENSKSHIAARVRDAREWKALSQVAMAKHLDMARQTYLDLESGKTEPRVTTLVKIAKITGRPLGWFIEQDLIPDTVDEHDDLRHLVDLFIQVPDNVRAELLEHHIGLMTCYIEQLKLMKNP